MFVIGKDKSVKMKVSIITACYNSGETIEDTIKSVINQTYSNIEYIIIDGESKDNTLEIVNGYKDRVSKISIGKDDGIYFALNKGLSLATGDIIGFLHSDDFYFNDRVIENVVACFKKNKTESIYGDLVYVDSFDTNKMIRYWKSGKYRRGSFKFGWMPPHPSFFVKREIYEKYGMFNTTLKSAADYEFMLRILHCKNITVSYLKEVLVKMRVGGKSNATIGNRIKANLEDRKAWALNDVNPFWFTLYLKPLRKLKQYFLKYP